MSENVDETGHPRRMPDGSWAICSFEGCEGPVKARRFCNTHYLRSRSGRPLHDVERDQRGERNPSWKGDEAGYWAFHQRVRALRGRPKRCSRCGTEDPSKRYEWANLTGRYEDVSDYERMCTSCHHYYDEARRNFESEHGTPAGCRWHRRRGQKPCEPCRTAWNAYAREAYRKRSLRKSPVVGEFDVAGDTR